MTGICAGCGDQVEMEVSGLCAACAGGLAVAAAETTHVR